MSVIRNKNFKDIEEESVDRLLTSQNALLLATYPGSPREASNELTRRSKLRCSRHETLHIEVMWEQIKSIGQYM